MSRKPMRVLFYCGGSQVAGVEILTFSILRALRERGHQVFCLVSGWNDGRFIAMLDEAGLEHAVVKLGSLYLRKPFWTLDTLAHYPAAARTVSRVRSRFKPDAEWHVSYRWAFMLFPFLDPRRTVLHVHDRDHPGAGVRFAYRLLTRKVTRFVAVSRFIADHLASLGVPENKTEVILNGVAAERTTARGSAWSGPPRVGIVGQIIERKGHLDLLRALRILLEKGVGFRCSVFGAGDPAFVDGLIAESRRLGLADLVHWMGFLGDRNEIYSNLDLVVVPTRDPEPFGLVAVEPALWGLPVIASRAGGLTEVVEDGVTGLLFKPTDPFDLADKLELLLRDGRLRERLGEQGRRRGLADFSLERMVGGVEDLLERLAGAPAPAELGK